MIICAIVTKDYVYFCTSFEEASEAIDSLPEDTEYEVKAL